MRKKIGECLIQARLITEDDLKTALAEHKRTGERVGVVLVRMNLATEKQIAKALAFQLGFPYVNLAENPPDPSAVVLIPKEVALKRVCIAAVLEKNLLTVAMSDPLLFSLVQDLEFQTGYRIKQVVATHADITDAINTCYPDKALILREAQAGGNLAVQGPPRQRAAADVASSEVALARRPEEDVFEPVAGLQEGSETAPIIDLVDLVVKSAIKSKASDVHVEPMEKGVLIRHRLDGLLKEGVKGGRRLGQIDLIRAGVQHGDPPGRMVAQRGDARDPPGKERPKSTVDIGRRPKLLTENDRRRQQRKQESFVASR